VLRAIVVRETATDQAKYPSALGTTPRKMAAHKDDVGAVAESFLSAGSPTSAIAAPAQTDQAVADSAPTDSASGLTTT